jgi:Rha family phage regulatory protein
MSNKLLLLPNDQYGMGIVEGKEIVATSRAVAELFNKRHADVLRSIENCDCSEEFRQRNFALTSYRDEQNKKQPMVLMTKDGFAFIVMGFTGKKAAQFKEAYINRFNDMEQALQARQLARMECRQLTDAIKSAHDPVKPYHFSNEMNMLLQIVTGKNAKQLKEERGLPEDATVRDYLKTNEISLLASLQPVAAFLNVTTPDYQERKRLLSEYASRLMVPGLIGTQSA